MHAVKDAFDEFNTNKSEGSEDVLDKDEFQKALQKLKVDLTEDDLKTLRVDADKDGNVDEAEFRHFVANLTFAGVDVPVGRNKITYQ